SPADRALADFVATFYADPLGFVQACYPWGEPGPLEQHTGPDTWQAAQLAGIGEDVRRNAFNGHDPVPAIRRVTSSGHGIGKSAEVAWLVDWIMSTRPYCQGTVTANTFTQLQTKTWAAIRAWTKLCLTGHWFRLTDRRMVHPEFPESWFCALQSSQETNSEAFAGQHAATSTSFYVFDEASAIPRVIWEVAEGGLTDGEPMIFTFGNPTRNEGPFHEACFGRGRDTWAPGSTWVTAGPPGPCAASGAGRMPDRSRRFGFRASAPATAITSSRSWLSGCAIDTPTARSRPSSLTPPSDRRCTSGCASSGSRTCTRSASGGSRPIPIKPINARTSGTS